MDTPNRNAASQRTRQKIRTAFAELIQEQKTINNLHVTDLVQRADITRSTFYRHYNNLREVAQDFQTEITQVFFANDTHPLQPYEIDAYFDRLTKFLETHTEIYRMLLNSHDTPTFLNQLNQQLNKKLYRALTHQNDPFLLLEVNFFVGGITTLILEYLHHDLPMSLNDINQYAKHKFHQTFFQHHKP